MGSDLDPDLDSMGTVDLDLYSECGTDLIFFFLTFKRSSEISLLFH